MAKKYSSCILFFLFYTSVVLAQHSYQLTFHASTEATAILEKLDYPTTIQNKEALNTTLKTLLQELQNQSYYAASIDSVHQQDSIFHTYLTLGHAYNDFQITNGNIPKKYSTIKRSLNTTLSYEQVKSLQENLLNNAADSGHPFATTWLEEIQIEGPTIKAKLFWQPGPTISIGTLNIEGAPFINTNYLTNYLNIHPNQLFKKTQIEAASAKLQELPFLQSTRTPAILFKEDIANLYFFLEPKKANRFDFLIGVLPNNQETDKVLITADIDAAFYNQFGRGEELFFKFEQLRPETQQLKLATTYPYLLNTPLGVYFEFGLYKRDSLYRDLNWDIGLQYQFESQHYLKVFSKNISTTLLTINQASLQQNRQLPANLDTRYSAFGIAYGIEKLDYRWNPQKGWTVSFLGSAGFKEIKRNTNIINASSIDFDFNTLYDQLELNSFQYQLQVQAAKYFALQKRSTFKIALDAATTISKNLISQNEQFRIGGANLLRGFDEQSVFASSYGIVTGEYRYLIGQRSYFNVFGDIAWLENKTMSEQFTDQPIGVGAGMTFETKAGIFAISYALGKRRGEAFDFQRAKLHFGLISVF